jgi:tetratricopeptide (TPR) repeat protein
VANFRKARDVVNRFYVQLTKDYLLNEPGMQPLRKELAQQALAFHQDFVEQQGDDPDIQADLGKSLLVLADITSDTGAKARAIEFVQRAIALFDQLAHDHPDVAENRRESALCRNKLGAFYNSAHERANAEEAFRQAQERFQQLVKEAPQDRDDRNGLGLASNNLGVLLVAMGNFAEAKENLGKAMQIREGLAHEDPESTDYQRNLADSYNGRAQVAFGTRHPEQAVQDLEEARRIRQQLAAKHPEVIELQNDLAGACNNLALVYRKIGRREEALRTYQEALDLRSRVAERNPTVTQFQRDLANVYHNWGNLYLADLEKASTAAEVEQAYGPGLEKYRKGLEISQKLSKDHPQVLQFRIDVGMAYCSLGNFVYYVRKSDAVPWYDQAIAILAKVPEEDRSPEVGQGLGESYWGRAGALSEAGQQTQAWTEWKLALQHDHGPSAGALRSEAEEWANQLSTLPAWPVLGSATVGLLGTASGQGPLLAACGVLPGRAGEPFLSGEIPYGLAVVCAQLAASVLLDEDLPQAEREQRASTYKARAMALLRRTMATGYCHARDRRSQLLMEPGLEPLRSLPEFQDLLNP